MALTAEIIRAQPSLESTPYATLVLRFHNDGLRPVRVRRYRVAWTQGSFEARPGNLIVPARGTREWTARITYRQGDIKALLADARRARVSVLESQ